jgi:hypothetical protein
MKYTISMKLSVINQRKLQKKYIKNDYLFFNNKGNKK